MREGLTFDDVLLVPKRSSVTSRKDVETSTYLSRNIKLNVPIVSSNMDTVTESKMAIVMAQMGAIGIIHRFMSVEDHVSEVTKVKRSEMIRIDRPYRLRPENTLDDARAMMEDKGISGILITDPSDKLVGILTTRDIMFEEDGVTKISDLMSTDLVTASPDITIESAKDYLQKNRMEKLPLIDEKGFLKGLITSKDIIKSKVLPDSSKDSKGRLLVAAAIGVRGDYLHRAEKLVNADVDALVIDIAHGDSDLAVNTVKEIRKNFSDIEIIAGNVATGEGTKALIEAGCDAVKVGVGPGSICLEGDTLITMSDYSVKRIKDVVPGDIVVTHRNNKRSVTKKYTRKFSGDIYNINIKGSPGNIKITSEHPVLAISFDSDEEKIKKFGSKYYFDKKKHNLGLEWLEASSLKRGDLVVVPRTIARKTKKLQFDLTDYVNCLFDDRKVWSNKVGFNPNKESFNDLAIRFSTTKRIIGNIVKGGKSQDMILNQEVNEYLDSVDYQRTIDPLTINRYIKLNEDLMRLFGYFVAEGFVIGAKNNRQLVFGFSKDETDYHNNVKNLVKNTFGYANTKVRYHKTKNSAEVRVYSHYIASFFERIFPLGSKNKKFPNFIFEQENHLLIELIKGAFYGDGSISEKRKASYKTVSASLAFQMSEILIRLGFLPTISKEKKREERWSDIYKIIISGSQYDRFMDTFYPSEEYLKVTKSAQQIWADEAYIYLKVHSVEKENRETIVYNLEVDEDNSYLTNRIAVHNCITRIVTGCGVPQLTAIMDCAKVAKDYNIPIIADGGVRNSGDLTKAIAAGASTVMIGGLFAGTEESPGTTI
ncbi:MAG: IMP dehydrogenase, partial [Candidatus Heimdallarchaeota archaeon]|nr:IMP dehydrogenase [Candidatus Heimdallarchaeota archaeon]MCK4613093.1 IMP dehydrogenase [Candidatus Heimdallarchaeota archaeon]